MDEYLKGVEINFEIVKKDVEARQKCKTSIKDVLQYMIDTKDTIIWHPSYSINNQKTSTGSLISHKGCSRASDLKIFHPDLVEARQVGTIHVYRLRRENPHAIKQFMNI